MGELIGTPSLTSVLHAIQNPPPNHIPMLVVLYIVVAATIQKSGEKLGGKFPHGSSLGMNVAATLG